MLYELVVLKNFAKFTGKLQCPSFFFSKFADPHPFLRISFFAENLRAAASVSKHVGKKSLKCSIKGTLMQI